MTLITSVQRQKLFENGRALRAALDRKQGAIESVGCAAAGCSLVSDRAAPLEIRPINALQVHLPRCRRQTVTLKTKGTCTRRAADLIPWPVEGAGSAP
jgi:hypothetical protein